MQLGELQKNIKAFEKRGVQLLALSVDDAATSMKVVERGITIPIGADPKQLVIDTAYHLQNPQDKSLALHAIYIVDEGGEIFYRKVARRRPYSKELLDAIDAKRGVFKPKK